MTNKQPTSIRLDEATKQEMEMEAEKLGWKLPQYLKWLHKQHILKNK